eukprot:CAMPEP_0168557132 /NCGR_PEP_ID=MMETSP0413-20121227/9254_2 /TAXON_ID=136452 /ORGANISM="Filamoeba nolandi, Strain NC-AS-23-1" /LENGTH=47 /DNA_ID= /DNA_START= /DNA_END= /DNA_ORIENTATION=
MVGATSAAEEAKAGCNLTMVLSATSLLPSDCFLWTDFLEAPEKSTST